MKRRLLVTGASGFLGWQIARSATDWEVHGSYWTRSCHSPTVIPHKVDLTQVSELQDLWATVRPDAVIHLAALSQPNLCQQQPDLSYQINVVASETIAELCATQAIPCVFTSTDLVFDGLAAPYREDDRPNPVSLYGEHKVLAEAAMLRRYPPTAVCRMPLMFGLTPPGVSSFLQPFVQTLRSGQMLNLFVDEFRTPVSGESAAQGLLWALQQVQGRIHLGGAERISRYEFGRLMAEILALPIAGLQACRQADVTMAAPRPPDVSLDSSRAFGLGYRPEPLRAAIAKLKGIV